MRKQASIEIKVCDVCGSEKNVWDTCRGCGKDYCYDCAKKKGVDYHHAVFVSGSGDSFFCNECHIEITNDRTHKQYRLHEVYMDIVYLKKEYEAWHEKFDTRAKEAEERVKYFLKEQD